jgi:hypothetical protein
MQPTSPRCRAPRRPATIAAVVEEQSATSEEENARNITAATDLREGIGEAIDEVATTAAETRQGVDQTRDAAATPARLSTDPQSAIGYFRY